MVPAGRVPEQTVSYLSVPPVPRKLTDREEFSGSRCRWCRGLRSWCERLPLPSRCVGLCSAELRRAIDWLPEELSGRLTWAHVTVLGYSLLCDAPETFLVLIHDPGQP